MWNSPRRSVVIERTPCRLGLLTDTVAPGTAWPALSTASPTIRPVVWAVSIPAMATRKKMTRSTRSFIGASLRRLWGRLAQSLDEVDVIVEASVGIGIGLAIRRDGGRPDPEYARKIIGSQSEPRSHAAGGEVEAVHATRNVALAD